MIQPHPGQEAVLNSQMRHRVVVGGRRWGKTALCSLIVERERTGKQQSMLYVTLTQKLMHASWRLFKPFIDSGELHYTTPGSDYARGREVDLLIIDNAEYIPVSFYDILRPCIARGGKLLVLGTMQPEIEQMQLLWSLYGNALDPEHTDWQGWRFPSFNNHYLSRDELTNLEHEMPADLYRTTILSEFPRVE